jgi:hypothetical protein
MDLFSITRNRESTRNLSREELSRDRALRNERIKKFVKLKPGLYFDPVDRVLLRRSGSQYFYVRGDRRRKPRLDKATAEAGSFRLIAGGLFWDPSGNAIYKKSTSGYILYSRDRRKAGTDRRKKKSAAKAPDRRKKKRRS